MTPEPQSNLEDERANAPAERSAPLATPKLDELLARVRGNLARLVWLHGLGTIAGATAAWILVAFLVDWILHVPSGIRWVHLAVLGLVPGFLILRELVRPLRALPGREEIAVLVERAHPDLRQLIVSAAELSRAQRPDGDPSLVREILRRAEQRSATLDPRGVLDERRPRKRALLGLGASAFVGLVLLANASAARVFLERLFGGDTPWPRRTQLVVEVPLPGASAIPTAENAGTPLEPREIRLRVARGSDVPLLVHAQGNVPDEVVLHFHGGQRAVLASTGGPIFRTQLRSLQEDTQFYVTGGDDDDEVPWVRLDVLQPPDVEALAFEITPPAYSGLPSRVERDRDVEVLAGSEIVVHVLPTPRDATGSARLVPEDRVVTLTPRPFPEEQTSSEAGAGDAAAKERAQGLGFGFRAEKSLRLRVELVDSTGLSNPDPGLFAVNVIEDRAPELEVLAPSRSEVDTLVGGLLRLRVRVEDDFGITRAAWSAESSSGTSASSPSTDAPAKLGGELELRALEPEELADSKDESSSSASRSEKRRVRARALASARLEVAALAGPNEKLAEGQQYALLATALDNAQPGAREGKASPVRVRVVTADEFVRRMQDRLARVQGSANALAELQRDKARRTDELLAALESDQLDLASTEAELGAVSTGERRVQGDARTLAREICSVCESVLYARLDDRAGALLDALDTRLSASAVRAFDPAPWREIAGAHTRGELGQGALAGKLVEIAGLALEISEDHAQEAVAALARAQQATEVKAVHAALEQARASERLAAERLDALLSMLAEWDNFQSVLGLTRDLLQGQKSLQERTKGSLKEK